MAGPTASIIFKERLPVETLAEIESFLVTKSNYCEDENKSFWINERPFLWWNGEEYPGEFEDYWTLPEFGWFPEDQIGFAAMCNQHEDHRILGELCLTVANRFGGLVAFGADLELPQSSLPGNLWKATYENVAGTLSFEHVGDAEFMKAWLNHPGFYMVK